jgi:hypothetical protein
LSSAVTALLAASGGCADAVDLGVLLLLLLLLLWKPDVVAEEELVLDPLDAGASRAATEVAVYEVAFAEDAICWDIAW